MANKKAKKSKTMGKKDLKKTKGGLLPAVNVGNTSYKELSVNGDLTVLKQNFDLGGLNFHK